MKSKIYLKIGIFILISLFLLGVVIGCGSNEDQSTKEDVKVNQSSDEVSINSDKQETNISTDLKKSVKIPEGYPKEIFPIYKDAFVSAASKNQDDSYSLIYFVNESKETIIDYYKNLLSEANNNMETNNEDGYMNLGNFEGYNYNLVISAADESIGYKNMVTIILVPSKVLEGE